MYDVRFDWLPILNADFVNALVSEMFKAPDIKQSGVNVERVHQQRTYIARHVISALYQAWSSPHTLNTVSYPQKSSVYGKKIPSQIPYSRIRAKEVFDRLSQMDWIEVTQGIANVKYTRIKAKGFLKEHFEMIGIIWCPQLPIPDKSSIIVRDVKRDIKGRPVRDKKTGRTEKFDLVVDQSDQRVVEMQQSLRVINSFMARQCITIDLTDDQLNSMKKGNGQDTQDQIIDLRQVQLVRIFSRGDLDKGGRFYRGWWQSIPSKHRSHLRINGLKTIEVDYSAIHLRILYSLGGLEYPADKDPYDIGLNNWNGKNDSRRKIIKKCFNAMINDEDSVFRLKKKDEKALGLSHDQFVAKIKCQHPKIYEQLERGIGLQLQKIDSDIAEKVMRYFVAKSVPCLPVHDSFIVPAGYKWDLHSTLKRVFREVVGSEINVDDGVIKNTEHFDLDVSNINFEEAVYTGDRIWQLVKSSSSSSSSRTLMGDYLRSYREQQSGVP